jgi:hypothetical protein
MQPGNTLSMRHGSYSTVWLSKRAAQVAAEVRDVMPVYEPADEPVVRLLALALARVEAAAKAIDRLDSETAGREIGAYMLPEPGMRLRQDLRGWMHTAAKLAAELGLTPVSRGRLGVSVAMIQSERARQELLAKYGGER